MCHCGDVRNNVFLYFAEKIILHTSKAFVEVWIAGMLSLFFDIFSLVAIEKRSGYPFTVTNIICKLYLWTVTLVAVVAFWYICVDIFRKKSLSASGESGCGYLESPLIF